MTNRSIASIIHELGKAGSHGSWKCVKIIECEEFEYFNLTHYGYLMLQWHFENGKVVVDYHSRGHGSKSDQGGMNIAFKQLGLDWYYSRKDGIIYT